VLPETGLLKVVCGVVKVWSACGQHEIQYTKLGMKKYTYNYIYNFISLFFCTTGAEQDINYW
jgi:hypothetical protein